MVGYSIEAALQSQLFEEVYVSSEEQAIADIAISHGAKVPALRPQEFAGDNIGVVDVCLYLLDSFAKDGKRFDYLCVLLPTSPLRQARDLEGAFQLFQQKGADFLMATTQYTYQPCLALHEENDYLKPFFDAKYFSESNRSYPDLFVDNGAIYLMKVEAFQREKTFYGKKLIGYPMPRHRSVDVDNLYSFKLAEFFLENMEEMEAEE